MIVILYRNSFVPPVISYHLLSVSLRMPSEPNKLIIIAAPSGAGKTSVTRHLLRNFPDQLAFSVSCATRPPRNNEKDKVDYYFISVEAFKQKIQNNEFVEWEMVYEGKYYGTLKSELARIWKMNRTPLLDVDVKGGIHIQQQFPETSLSLFIEPPSIEALRARLEARGTETVESLEARISKASYELSFKSEFNTTIINDRLDLACEQAEKIVREFLER
jgi:guanylate kinase